MSSNNQTDQLFYCDVHRPSTMATSTSEKRFATDESLEHVRSVFGLVERHFMPGVSHHQVSQGGPVIQVSPLQRMSGIFWVASDDVITCLA